MLLNAKYHIGARLALRVELRKRGMASRISEFTEAATDDVIDLTAEDLLAQQQIQLPTGAFGDGKIIDAIISFFQSPQGKALIDALIKLLIGLLGA